MVPSKCITGLLSQWRTLLMPLCPFGPMEVPGALVWLVFLLSRWVRDGWCLRFCSDIVVYICNIWSVHSILMFCITRTVLYVTRSGDCSLYAYLSIYLSIYPIISVIVLLTFVLFCVTQGPFRPQKDMSLTLNEFAWNSVSNMVRMLRQLDYWIIYKIETQPHLVLSFFCVVYQASSELFEFLLLFFLCFFVFSYFSFPCLPHTHYLVTNVLISSLHTHIFTYGMIDLHWVSLWCWILLLHCRGHHRGLHHGWCGNCCR